MCTHLLTVQVPKLSLVVLKIYYMYTYLSKIKIFQQIHRYNIVTLLMGRKLNLFCVHKIIGLHKIGTTYTFLIKALSRYNDIRPFSDSTFIYFPYTIILFFFLSSYFISTISRNFICLVIG